MSGNGETAVGDSDNTDEGKASPPWYTKRAAFVVAVVAGVAGVVLVIVGIVGVAGASGPRGEADDVNAQAEELNAEADDLSREATSVEEAAEEISALAEQVESELGDLVDASLTVNSTGQAIVDCYNASPDVESVVSCYDQLGALKAANDAELQATADVSATLAQLDERIGASSE